jgi:hypothetical protein
MLGYILLNASAVYLLNMIVCARLITCLIHLLCFILFTTSMYENLRIRYKEYACSHTNRFLSSFFQTLALARLDLSLSFLHARSSWFHALLMPFGLPSCSALLHAAKKLSRSVSLTVLGGRFCTADGIQVAISCGNDCANSLATVTLIGALSSLKSVTSRVRMIWSKR